MKKKSEKIFLLNFCNNFLYSLNKSEAVRNLTTYGFLNIMCVFLAYKCTERLKSHDFCSVFYTDKEFFRMFQSKRVGRGQVLHGCFRIITESAYENRFVFRAICFMTALGLMLSVIIATVPQTAVNVIRLSLGEFQAAANVTSGESGSFYLDPAAVAATPEDLESAVRSLAVREETVQMQRSVDFQRVYTTTLSAEEARVKIDAINAEKARIAEEKAARERARQAAIASATVYNGSFSYIGLNTAGVPMSEKGDVEVDGNGVPVHYSYCITAKATAYTADTITSTGTRPVQGTVAVDPTEIPYGTRLYITSADGLYVYGYAVAEDTGGFIYFRNGATVDLYMYSDDDVDEWGWRTANIYVLD